MVMEGGFISEILLVFTTLFFALDMTAGKSPCEEGLTWWNSKTESCLNCTICDTANLLTVLRPCELHRDTLCLHIRHLKIEWPKFPKRKSDRKKLRAETKDFSNRVNPIWREIYKPTQRTTKKEMKVFVAKENDYIEYDDYYISEIQDKSVSAFKWDTHSTALALASTGCLVFFVLVIFLSLNQRRQWKRLKQALEHDVQELTAKLQISYDQTRIPASQHLYSNIHDNGLKNNSIGICRMELKNVYTEESYAEQE